MEERMRKVEGFDDIYYYENHLYKLKQIKEDGGDPCQCCDLNKECNRDYVRMSSCGPYLSTTFPCWYHVTYSYNKLYFKKMKDNILSPLPCSNCKNYKPSLPSTIDEVKMIWNDGVDADNLSLYENLLKARDIYRQGWEPNQDNNRKGCVIVRTHLGVLDDSFKTIEMDLSFHYDRSGNIFSFQSMEVAQMFLDNFKNELEKFYKLR